MRKLAAVLSVALSVAVGVGLLAAPGAQGASSRVEYSRAKVIRWVDGDTVLTTRGKVRLIGVDTPERGRCGYGTATRLAQRWAPRGSTVKLGNPASVRDKDVYGRALRYVVKGKRDISRSQIQRGARARYDGQDGYQWHPRQARYHRTDAAHANYSCSSTPANPAPLAAPAPPPVTGGAGSYPPSSISTCPSYAPIKGNRGDSGWIYHQPGQRSYTVTHPEECFATTSAAEAAGYRAAKA